MNRISITVLTTTFAVLALSGAGCINVSGQSNASDSASRTVVGIEPAKPCTATGGTYDQVSGRCSCGLNFTYDQSFGECVSVDGLPGGERGIALRKSFEKSELCQETGGAYDPLKAWCDCGARLFEAVSGRCIDTATATSETTGASTMTLAEEEATVKCQKRAVTFLKVFSAERNDDAKDAYTDFRVASHYDLVSGRCSAAIDFRKRPDAAQVVTERVESLNDVDTEEELASCTVFANTKTGDRSETCFVYVGKDQAGREAYQKFYDEMMGKR